MEAKGFSKHAVVVIAWRHALAFDVGLLEAMVMADECESHGAGFGYKAAIEGDGGVDIGECVREGCSCKYARRIGMRGECSSAPFVPGKRQYGFRYSRRGRWNIGVAPSRSSTGAVKCR